MTGCTKRYTDPSSLRKHVKNHNPRNKMQSRRKSHKDDANTSTHCIHNNENSRHLTPLHLPETIVGKQRCYSESSAYPYASDATLLTPTPNTAVTSHSNHFTFEDVFNEIVEHEDGNNTSPTNTVTDVAAVVVANAATNENEIMNTMNFNEMSDCIVTIQNAHQRQPHSSQHQQHPNSYQHEELHQTQQRQQPNYQHQHAHEQYKFSNALGSNTSSATSTIDSGGGLCGSDEFVSFECVQKILGEQNMDFIDSSIQNQIEIDYFEVA